MGGLIPTHFHLNPLSLSAFDQSAEDTLREKRRLIELAIKEGWLVIFNHSIEKHSGYLEQSGKNRNGSRGKNYPGYRNDRNGPPADISYPAT